MHLKHLAGFSLLEVLISLLLLSCILLGFDGAELYSLRQMHDEFYEDMADKQLNNMIERLHAVGKYSIHDSITKWNKENSLVLPNGAGDVSGVYPDYKITIKWGTFTGECEHNQFGNSGCMTQKIHI